MARSLKRPLPVAGYFPPSVFYLSLLVLLAFGYLFFWPVEALDTDLWYHLNCGRYILAHRLIPDTSFFSFISPPRLWVDYYWLFQVWVYSLYRLGGYPLLVVFRALIYLGILSVVLAWLLSQRKDDEPVSWRVFLVACVALVLLPRSFVIRPHLFTYLFIVLFLAILERRPQLAWLLPLMAVAWCNLHGVTYPVLMLISGAYLCEGLLKPGKTAASAWPLMLCLAAPLLTPHGARLLLVPFISTVDASKYIQELTRIAVEDLMSIHIGFMSPAHQTVFVIVLLAAVLSLWTALQKRSLRISHLLLFLGGLGLLLRAQRFSHEFSLLALPLLSSHCPLPKGVLRHVPKPAYLTVLALLLLMPLRMIVSFFYTRPAFPFSRQGLPYGVTAFLRQTGIEGKVLNMPNNGGWLQWQLYPAFRIAMDMEVPFLFTDADMQWVQDVFAHKLALRECLKRYQPDFITAPIHSDEFKELVDGQRDYAPVFFDDEEVLYANAVMHPKLVEDHRLVVFENPFQIMSHTPEEVFDGNGKELAKKDRALAKAELRRLLSIDPQAGVPNHLLAWLLLDQGKPEEALIHARRLTNVFPQVAVGFRLQGDCLKALSRYEEAKASYGQAAERVDGGARRMCLRKIGQVHLAQGNVHKAYRLLSQSTLLYAPITAAEDIYYLGHAALLLGKREEARHLLDNIARNRLSPKDAKWLPQLNADLRQLGLTEAVLPSDKKVDS